MDDALFREFTNLGKEKRRLEKALLACKARRAEVEAQILPDWLESETTSLHRHGRNVVMTSTWAAYPLDQDMPRLCKALRIAHHGDLVAETTNYNTLSAWVRERVADHEIPGRPAEEVLRRSIPAGVRAALQASRSYRLNDRAAS